MRLALAVLTLVGLPALVRAQPAPSTVPMDDAARRSQIVARVGDVTITLGQVEDEVNHQSPFMRSRYHGAPAELRAYVEEIVRVELIAREAVRRGYEDDAQVIDAVEQTSVQLLIRRDFDERITADSIAADDVREYYEQHPDEFHQPELRRASHLVLATREEADGFVAQTRTADARAFRQLVMDHSADTETRIRGGDLRYFDAQGHTPNAGDPDVPIEAVQAAFALANVGDVSEVVTEGARFAIVELTGVRPREDRSLSDADGAIRTRLWRTRRQAALETFVDALRARIPTELFVDRMRNIHMEPPERSSTDPLPADPDEVDPADPTPPLSPDQVLGGAAPPSSAASE